MTYAFSIPKAAESERRDAITVMVALAGTHGKPMNKGWRLNENQEYEKTYSYPKGFLFNFHETRFNTIFEIMNALFDAAKEVPTVCFCLGRIRDGQEVVFNARRLLVERHGDEGVLTRGESTMMPLDFDKLVLPDDMALTDTDAIIGYVLSLLPPEFKGVDFVWQLTSSHLVAREARVRLYFLSDIDLDQAQLDAIFADIPVDHACFRAAQIIYIVQPSFEEGAEDPVPERYGFVQGDRERVEMGPLLERANARMAFTGSGKKREKKAERGEAEKTGEKKDSEKRKKGQSRAYAGTDTAKKTAMRGLSFEKTLDCIGDDTLGFNAPVVRAVWLGVSRFPPWSSEFDAEELERLIWERVWANRDKRPREYIEERRQQLPGHIKGERRKFERQEAERGKVYRDPPGVVRPTLTADAASAAIAAPIDAFFAKVGDRAIDVQHAACARRGIRMERAPQAPQAPPSFNSFKDDLFRARWQGQTLIPSDLAVGKTRAATRAAIRFVNGGFNPPAEQPVVPLRALFCVNDHVLAREIAATLNTQEPGVAAVWLGLRQPRHADKPDGELMCKRPKDADAWLEAGGKMQTMCLRCPHGKKKAGNSNERCGYSLQEPRDVKIVIVAGPSTLLAELPGKLQRKVRVKGKTVTFAPFDVTVIDEPRPVEWTEGLDEPLVVELADTAGTVRPPDIGRTEAAKWGLKEWVHFDRLMEQAAAVAGLAATLGHGEMRQLTRAEAGSFNPEDLRTLLQRLRMKPPAAASTGTGEEIAAALADDSTWNRRVRRLVALCDATIATHKVEGGTIAPNLIAGNHADWGTGLQLRLRQELTWVSKRAPTLLLDATGDAELLKVWWPYLEVAEEVRVRMPEAVRVVQVSDTLAPYRSWARFASPPAEGCSATMSEDHNRSVSNMMRVAWLADVIASRIPLGMVVPKAMEAALAAAWKRRGWKPESVVLGHHGAIRGQNRFAAVRVFINLSRMAPGIRKVEDLTETLSGRVASRIAPDANGDARYSHPDGARSRHYVMRGGGVVQAELCEWHPDPLAERVRAQMTDSEIDQADGRSRAIRRDATTPLLHIRATSQPSDRLEVDELVTMDQVFPFDGFDALLARGVFVPTGNSFKGGQQLLADILSVEASLLRGTPVNLTRKAVQHALQRKCALSAPKPLYRLYRGFGALSIILDPDGFFPPENASPPRINSGPGANPGWSEWSLPRGRYAVRIFLELAEGTDAEAAKAFLVERAFLPAEAVAGLRPYPEASKSRKGRKRRS